MSSFEAKLESMLRVDHERAIAYALSVQLIAEGNASVAKILRERIKELEAELAQIQAGNRDSMPSPASDGIGT
jgi:hypothetical protein